MPIYERSRELDVKAAEQANIEFTNGKLLVKHPKLRTAFTNKYSSVEVLVELPTGSDVQGRTPTGDIRVEQATGAQLKTTGGKVIVDHVTGQADVSGNVDIRVRQVDGGAVVKNIRGDSWVGEVVGTLPANSANGHITVNVARAAVNAHTSNGDIRVGELGSGTVGLYTATGEVEVGIPQGIAARLDAHTSTGRVRNYLEAPDAS
ncbi:MAG: DUF4097 family beta strand repeat-containing protein [Frankiaceae bacterium]